MIDQLQQTPFDVLIVGGGINGAVAAAALAGRGVKTALIDKGDFAGFTSMNSSNLAWGGIKYMETYDFGLVRQLCLSRNRLLRSYPSTVREIRFFTTLRKGFRHHPLKLWLGAWLYWLIGNCYTRPPRLLTRQRIAQEEPVVNATDSSGGLEYSDAYLYDNDARFVFNFVRSALDRGAVAVNYVESTGAQWVDGRWTVLARDVIDGQVFPIRAHVLINAAGAFVDEHNRMTGDKTEHQHVFSKGVHLLVNRLTPKPRVLAFFADDGRLFFVIPMGPKTCIGTTDTRVDVPCTAVTAEDRRFILDNINHALKLQQPLTEQDIIAERWGVRPLVVKAGSGESRDFLQLSRKHAVEVNASRAHISIFGGKLTDCINVGDEICTAVKQLGIKLPYPDYTWYGEPSAAVREEFLHQARLMDLDRLTPPTSSEPLSARLWRRYGAEAIVLLEDIRRDPRQAELLIEGTEYIRCELIQAARREMIVKLDDFLRRGSKLALEVRREDIRRSAGLLEACEILFGAKAREKFDEYFAA